MGVYEGQFCPFTKYKKGSSIGVWQNSQMFNHKVQFKC
jgi:hypothetical protein